jgi:2-oxoglutarate dehydrogenase E2 component (dihydrolipoamide succinyltransferase)
VSLTIDHRALDGHQTNAWLTHFVRVIETWPTDQGRLQAPD